MNFLFDQSADFRLISHLSPWEPLGPVEDAVEAARIIEHFLHG